MLLKKSTDVFTVFAVTFFIETFCMRTDFNKELIFTLFPRMWFVCVCERKEVFIQRGAGFTHTQP
jgi:hypothetical protein